MRLPRITLAFIALLGAPAWAEDLEAELTRCRGLEAEKASLMAADVPADMDRGPQWASANLPKERLQQIARFIEVDEQLKFRCQDVFASAALKEEEERARQQAREAVAWVGQMR